MEEVDQRVKELKTQFERSKNVDNGENKRLSDKYKILNIELETLLDDGANQREERNKLYDERAHIKGLLNKAYNTLRSPREENRKANDEYYTAIREACEERKEKKHLEKIQYEADKCQEAARQELELASLPAFEYEIILCDTLGAFFMDICQNADETYFMGSSNNSKKKGNNKITTKEKKSDTLKSPLSTMEGFFEVKLNNHNAIEVNKKKATEKVTAMTANEEETIINIEA
ncbi:hypothetical protein INT46_007574 [Mucor plumbeus]|uniref:Uncharacterized protein n=1 Tax=Mucor plumbeus TaxID=97098 RepID=A0A8H7UNK9_9FUNG|nr:hypothetical protein INT46_007574 [Mucor plumbeus]